MRRRMVEFWSKARILTCFWWVSQNGWAYWGVIARLGLTALAFLVLTLLTHLRVQTTQRRSSSKAPTPAPTATPIIFPVDQLLLNWSAGHDISYWWQLVLLHRSLDIALQLTWPQSNYHDVPYNLKRWHQYDRTRDIINLWQNREWRTL